MKRLIVIALLFMVHAGFSQSVPRLIELADKYYGLQRYLEAIEFYEKIVQLDTKNMKARYRLALCYRQALQYAEAEKSFMILCEATGHPFRAWSFYYYANLLMFRSQYFEADSLYQRLVSLPEATPDVVALANKHREGALLAIKQQKIDKGFRVHELEDVNSAFHDFGGVVNPSTKHLVFVTTRYLRGTQYEGNRFEGLLPDLVAFDLTKNNKWRRADSDQEFSSLNTRWAEGSGSFTTSGDKFYFSSCQGEIGSDCAIMVSYLENDRWMPAVPLNSYINEPGSENKQPFISSLGDTLFFVSDRPGSFGGSDIWMSLRGIERESWSPAINLGEAINSSENEISPYFSSAFNSLLFASDGHAGYGGFDIYMAKGSSFFDPEIYNLGPPFNSSWDDAYFNISDTVGYLSSNRKKERALDIYYFPVGNEELFLSLLISGESLIQTRIISHLRDFRSVDILTLRVEDYQGYEFFEPVVGDKPRPKILIEEPPPLAEGMATAGGNSATATIGNTTSNEGDGSYTRGGGAQRRRELGNPFERIYFNLTDAALRPEAKAALQHLLSQVNPDEVVKISLFGYTDHLGAESFNMGLSEQRGVSVKNFLVRGGIPEGKITVYARGELTSENERDHWYKRILRRRVEVIVETTVKKNLQKAAVYIVRENSTISHMAKQLGVKSRELRAWNGGMKEVVKAGNTLRVIGAKATQPNKRYFMTEENLEEYIKRAKR